MNELSRHIEILLVSHDCVTVPGLGGFVAHYEQSRFSDGIFYPPLRTLGFNAQLQHNDYLLAQSYQDAYDIPYPEAFRRIEKEVEEIRQTMVVNGEYVFHGIGTLTLDADNHLTFCPASAGILTPSLFGLGTFKLDELEEQPVNNSRTIPFVPVMRKVAAAILVMILFTLSILPAGKGSDDTGGEEMMQSSIVNTVALTNIIKDDARESTTMQAAPEETQQTKKVQSQRDYTIVLASKVSRSGANEMVSVMERNGWNDIRILESDKHNRKVVYGHYATESEAAKALSTLRGKDDTFAQAWILHHAN